MIMGYWIGSMGEKGSTRYESDDDEMITKVVRVPRHHVISAPRLS